MWQFTHPDYQWLQHDFARLEDGSTMILCSKERSVPSINPSLLKDDIIIIVDASGKIIWEWSVLDHFDQFKLSVEEKEAIYNAKPASSWGRVWLDVFHTNSIQGLPKNRHEISDNRFKSGNILVSSRNTNRIFVVERVTGDIAWQTKRTLAQHHASMIPEGLEGDGDIIVFDNGGRGRYDDSVRFFSRIFEFDPVTGIAAWKYQADMSKRPTESFFSYHRGSVQRLANGNTLICEATRGRIFEVKKDGTIVWEYIDQHFDKTGQLDYENLVYRAYRIEKSWINGPVPAFYW